MRWTMEDIQTALKEKEYVDTAVVPFLHISWGANAAENAMGSEYMKEFCKVMESMYRGRVILFPHLSYIKNAEGYFLQQLNTLEEQLQENGIQHIFYLTSDLQIKIPENKIIGSTIWLPPIPLQALDSSQQREILQTQVKSVMMSMEERWKTEKMEIAD